MATSSGRTRRALHVEPSAARKVITADEGPAEDPDAGEIVGLDVDTGADAGLAQLPSVHTVSTPMTKPLELNSMACGAAMASTP